MRTVPLGPDLRTAALLCLLLLGAAPSLAGVNRWTARGPGGGFVHEMAFSPADPERVFAIVDERLFRSDDAGRTWRAADAGRETVYTWRMRLDPHDADGVTTGTVGNGILRSRDGGETWFRPEWPVLRIEGIAFDPVRPGRILSHYGGLWESLDDGETWSPLPMPTFRPGYLSFLDCGHSARPLISSPDGLFLGDPGATSWWSPPGPWRDDETQFIPPRFVAGPPQSGSLFASYEGNIYKSTNCATSWSEIAALPSLHGALVAVPKSTLMIAASGSIFVSEDEGRSWKSHMEGVSELFLHPRNPDRWLFTLPLGYENIWSSDDGGVTTEPAWTGTATGMGSLTIDPITTSTLYSSGVWAGELWRSSNGGGSWQRLPTGAVPPGTTLSVPWNDISTHPLANHVVLANWSPICPGVWQPCPGEQLYRSPNGGDNWEHVEDHGAGWYARFFPAESHLYLASQSQVLRSQDEGRSWDTVPGPPIADSGPNGSTNYWRLAAVDPTDDTLYANSYIEGFWRGTDGGTNWHRLSDFTPTSLEVDPSTGALYAIVRDIGGYFLAESQDQGNSFQYVRELSYRPEPPRVRPHGNADGTVTLVVPCAEVVQPEEQPSDCGIWQRDATSPWQQLADRPGIDSFWHDFAIDPFLPNVFWSTDSGVARFDAWPGFTGLLDQWPRYGLVVEVPSGTDDLWIGDDFSVQHGEVSRLLDIVLWGRPGAGEPWVETELLFRLTSVGGTEKDHRSRGTLIEQRLAKGEDYGVAATRRLVYRLDQPAILEPGTYTLLFSRAPTEYGAPQPQLYVARGVFDPERGTVGRWSASGRQAGVALADRGFNAYDEDGIAMQLLGQPVLTWLDFESGNLD